MKKIYTSTFSVRECSEILADKLSFENCLEVNKSEENISLNVRYHKSTFNFLVKLEEDLNVTLITLTNKMPVSHYFVILLFIWITYTAVSRISEQGFHPGFLLPSSFFVFALCFGIFVRYRAIQIAKSFIEEKLKAVPR